MSKTVVANPGPGSYDTEDKVTSAIRKSANFKFGTSTRNNQNKAIMGNPGPGNYIIQRDLGKDSPSYSLSSKKDGSIKRIKEAVPGPGSYNNDNSFSIRSPPRAKFGRSQRISTELLKSHIPSPLEYSPKDTFASRKQNAPAFGFGTSRRSNFESTKNNPGPGNYSIPSKISEGPKFQMGIRIRDKKLNFSPSPDQYNPSFEVLKKSMPKFGMGSGLRYNEVKEDSSSPGPGSYNESSLKDSSFKLFKYGKFSNEQRERRVKEVTPGPGTYKIPSKIVEAPKYLFPSTDDKYAYV